MQKNGAVFSCSALLVLYFAVRINFWPCSLADKHKVLFLQYENFLAPQIGRATAFLIVATYIALCVEAEPVFGRRNCTLASHI